MLGSGGNSEPSTDPSAPLPARAWRLTHEQYRKSVVELTGVEPDLSNFSPETGNGKYTNFSSTSFVQIDLAQNYWNVAEEVAKTISRTKLSSLTSCDLTAACRDAFIAELGAHAFRMPVPAEVSLRLAAIYELAAQSGTPEAGYRAVLTAMLNSPHFLYRKELGGESAAAPENIQLTSSQVAEFLAYSLLDGPPPGWLQELAKSGAFERDASAALSSAVERLLSEVDAKPTMARFITEWLEVNLFDSVEKSEAFPGFSDVKPAMVEELNAFLAQSTGGERGLASLLTDPVPSVSPALDQFYLSDPSAPAAGERIGILGLGTVLSSHAKTYLTSPTQRGRFVRGRLFCRDITLPEGFTPPPLSETESLGLARTTRELYEQHQANPVCAECHRLTDNIGYALEAFDGAGRLRTLDTTQGASAPLNLLSELTDSDVNRPLTGAADLVSALSESSEVKACFARQAFRFYFGQVEGSPELPAVQAGHSRMVTEDSMQELLMGLLTSPNTLNRQRGTL